MTECQVCGAKSQLFLCKDHVAELRDTLSGLPRWIRHLAETAHGQTRLGDAGRRTRADEAPLRVNLRASDLMDAVANTLRTWVRHACDVRGVDVPKVTVTAAARWLSSNVAALAADETAGECLFAFRAHVEQIERAINRPVPPRPCGPCPTITGPGGQQCGRELLSRREDFQITCPACGETYEVEQLITRLMNQTHYLTFTVEELLRLLPLGQENVPRRTLYDWISKGRLQARGEDSLTGKPKYLMADVRRLRAALPRRQAIAS